MARHDHHFSDASFGATETGTPIDALLRPSLRRVFPLPAEGAGDERFRLLLKALTQCSPGNSRAVHQDTATR